MKIIIKVITVSIVVMLLASCSKEKTIELNVNIQDELYSSKDNQSKILITFFEIDPSQIKYKNTDAIDYAKKYSSLKDNSCGIFNNDPSKKLSDCAHFIAHCLNSGGIEIKAQNPDYTICKAGLCYRVVELVTALNELSRKYKNITLIKIEDAIIGDYGFLKIPAIRPTHAFMICKPAPKTDDFTIYAHTKNRSCEKTEPEWYQVFDVAFRITDAQ